MKVYAVSLSIGVLVGVIYGLLNVRSPAPPVVALVGLAGILLGEQVVPLGKRLLAGEAVTLSAVADQSREHVFGQLPHRRTSAAKDPPAAPNDGRR
jgi:XapX domain-containing protein